MAKGSGLTRKYELSDELADFVGKDTASRSEVTKVVWAYIIKHHLQDANDRRVIIPDDTLAEIIGSKKINMFKMTTALSKHFLED